MEKSAFLFISSLSIQADLLATQYVVSLEIYSLQIEGDAINIILAIQQPDIFKDWNFASIILDIHFHLPLFHSRKACKESRSANSHAHLLARWTAFNLAFESINSQLVSHSLFHSNQEWKRHSFVTVSPIGLYKKKKNPLQ